MKIIILSKEKKTNLNFLKSFENDIEEMSRLYKVSANIESMTLKEFNDLKIESKFFGYDPLKTNKYIDKIDIQEFDAKKLDKNKIYSNIELNIAKTNDLLK